MSYDYCDPNFLVTAFTPGLPTGPLDEMQPPLCSGLPTRIQSMICLEHKAHSLDLVCEA